MSQIGPPDGGMSSIQQFAQQLQGLGKAAGEVASKAFTSQTTQAESLSQSISDAKGKVDGGKVTALVKFTAATVGAAIGHAAVVFGKENDARTVAKYGTETEKNIARQGPEDQANVAKNIRARREAAASKILDSAIGSSSTSKAAEGAKTRKSVNLEESSPTEKPPTDKEVAQAKNAYKDRPAGGKPKDVLENPALRQAFSDWGKRQWEW